MRGDLMYCIGCGSDWVERIEDQYICRDCSTMFYASYESTNNKIDIIKKDVEKKLSNIVTSIILQTKDLLEQSKTSQGISGVQIWSFEAKYTMWIFILANGKYMIKLADEFDTYLQIDDAILDIIRYLENVIGEQLKSSVSIYAIDNGDSYNVEIEVNKANIDNVFAIVSNIIDYTSVESLR